MFVVVIDVKFRPAVRFGAPLDEIFNFLANTSQLGPISSRVAPRVIAVPPLLNQNKMEATLIGTRGFMTLTSTGTVLKKTLHGERSARSQDCLVSFYCT